MESTLVATASLAAMCLAGVVAPVLAQAAGAIARVRLPPGAAAGVLTLLLAGPALRVRPAAAEVPPPVVRLTSPADVDPVIPGPPGSAPPPAGRYTVVAGDCLWRIARRAIAAATDTDPTSAQIARFWPRIYEANRQVIGDDPDLILVGQTLLIPEV